jgi:cell division septation protein DedD
MAAGAVLAAALLCGVAHAPAHADVKAGVDAWSAGDFAAAVAEWQSPAEAGDPDALFNLAQAYRLGRGVDIDNARARQLYEEAARLGHVKAADNYGLMLFQEGEQGKAMPLVRAAAERGDPRAQYVLGLSHFNADHAPRDWTRAYALMTLASGTGLPQARDALAQMDQYVPEAQRSQAQALARELEASAKAQRSAELAAADLATAPSQPALAAAVTRPAPAPALSVAPARPKPAASTPAPASAPAIAAPRKPGRWRVQLGAFGVPGNADRMWSQLASHAALAGTRKSLIPSGKLTRLLATGFATEGEAARACTALKREGKACVVAGQG